MAFRVDDIVVTEKNVLLLSGGHQFVTDIEKNTDALDDGNFTRDRNPWNFYSDSGVMYHNIFDTDSFDVRTQTLTGSTRHSPNNSRSHEKIYMPHDSGYVGNCQFYGNAYTITNFTTSTVSSDVECCNGDEGTYCADHGIIRYERLSSYENPSEYYISPDTLFEPVCGVQFITEYPLNGFYMDFGDNETDDKPTIFGDSVLSKYYLDQNYSVSSYDVDDTKSRFRQLRTYYDIGNTGNSIYLVFRNNLYGTSTITEDGVNVAQTEKQKSITGIFPISTVGYMSNIVTMSTAESGTYYSSEPYSDMFKYLTISDVHSNLFAVKQPHDHTFILYIQSVQEQEGQYTKLTYVPTIGLERSVYYQRLDESVDGISIVELPHCVVIGTSENGILTVWSRDYLYDGGDTLVNFNPFQHACSGIPSFDSLSAELDGKLYGDVRLFYNGKDILGATAVVKPQEIKDSWGNVIEVTNQLARRVAFFSSNIDIDGQHYEMGQFFMPAGNPLYEIEVVSSESPVYEEVLSSVPFSTWNDTTKQVDWNYHLQNIKVVTDTEIVTSDPFQVSANYVSDCDILFDYSSTSVDDELGIGSYAFVQFEKYGLAKCYVNDIYLEDKMVKFTSTGPVNRYDSREKIWTKLEKPSDTGQQIKGKVVSYSDLKTIPSPSFGDIYSVINEHDFENHVFDPYTYFRYTIDGNTSSWVETSLDYISGYVENYEDLSEISNVVIGDVYLVSNEHPTKSIPLTSYAFFQYGVVGNLSSWNYLSDDSILIGGRVNGYQNLPGHSGSSVQTASEGDVYFVKSAHEEDAVQIDACSYCIYDKSGADSGKDSIVRRWENIEIKYDTGGELSVGDLVFKTTDTSNTCLGMMSYSEMMTLHDTRPGLQDGNYVILNSSGNYNGIDFLKGEFYKYDSHSTVSNGWVRIADEMTICRVVDASGNTENTNYKYLGCYDSFEQLTHISPPERGSIYLLINRYSRNEEIIPANSFYRYGYNDNQLDWWRYDIRGRVSGIVESTADLKYIKHVEHGDYYLVEVVDAIPGETYHANTFYEFGIDGNTSFWENHETVGDVKGTVTNYKDLFNILPSNLNDGYVYSIALPQDIEGYHVDKYSFYKFVHEGNSSEWVDIVLSSEPYSLQLSGHMDSYVQIENLSGDIGSYYYTESETEPLVFYRLELNNSVKFCTDSVFSVISYSEDAKKSILDVVDYVSSEYNTYFVSGKPALKSTFIGKDDNKITNSFSDFPLVERDMIKEPIFSEIKSVSAEMTPISGFKFALGYPIENSMGISLKTYSTECANHDASISLVKWNISSGEYVSVLNNIGGLHLQYNAICTDVYMNGTTLTSVDSETGIEMPKYSSTIYEYPHPCYGRLKTAGTGLPIFDGPFSSEMTTSDIFFVNGYLVVKNYSVEVSAGHVDDWWDESVFESGKHQQFSTGAYPSGGYVVTNFFADGGENGSSIPTLYDSELIFSSKEEAKTEVDSERFYDYNYLWHIKPVKPIEFYPESVDGKAWKPYYTSKYVDFIEYHNGYYYISLRSSKEHDFETVGYDIIETQSLFEERECVKLESGLIVSGIKFFDGHVAVEYEKLEENGETSRFIKWFDSGKSYYKVMPVLYSEDISSKDDPMKHSELKTETDYSRNVVASYDNVEVMNSLNRFTPVVNHKSNLFSIRIDDLGFEESEYLTEHQKNVLRTYFRNSITELVNSVKPAHTQLFDVYLD